MCAHILLCATLCTMYMYCRIVLTSMCVLRVYVNLQILESKPRNQQPQRRAPEQENINGLPLGEYEQKRKRLGDERKKEYNERQRPPNNQVE